MPLEGFVIPVSHGLHRPFHTHPVSISSEGVPALCRRKKTIRTQGPRVPAELPDHGSGDLTGRCRPALGGFQAWSFSGSMTGVTGTWTKWPSAGIRSIGILRAQVRVRRRRISRKPSGHRDCVCLEQRTLSPLRRKKLSGCKSL